MGLTFFENLQTKILSSAFLVVKELINLHPIRLLGASKEVCNVGFLLVFGK